MGTVDPGESEAITLALELRADALLVDELKARSVATSMGVKVVRALGLLLAARRRALIPAVRPLMDRLRNEINFFISDELYNRVCADANE